MTNGGKDYKIPDWTIMSLLQIASLLIVLAGAFGAINYLFLKLPSAIGILVVALIASFAVIATDALFPALTVEENIRAQVLELEFSEALLEGMLGLLLFAGALHVKLSDLRKAWLVILLMATIGVGLSTTIVGFGFHWLTGMPIMIALVFGALISPTDPVAVLGVLRQADLQKSLETKIAGESLFNDGVGYVVFLVLVGLAFPTGDDHHAAGLCDAAKLFFEEALGRAILGIVLGWLTFRVMRRIDDYSLEVLITLGLAFGGYELAVFLHVSAPIMAVCAGLLIGDIGARHGMSEETRKYVEAFWKLIDEFKITFDQYPLKFRVILLNQFPIIWIFKQVIFLKWIIFQINKARRTVFFVMIFIIETRTKIFEAPILKAHHPVEVTHVLD